MRQLLESQVDRLLDLGLAALLLSGFVALLMLGSPQPARRLRIARLGMIGVLLLPMLDQFQSLPDVNVGPLALHAWRLTGQWISPSSRSEATKTSAAPAVPILSISRPRTQEWPLVPDWVGWAYSLGIAGFSLRLVLGGLIARWLCATSSPPSPELMQLYESLPFDGEVRPGLGIADRIRRPLLTGFSFPKILLPSSLVAREPRLVATVLTHELSHAEEYDTAFGLLAECLLVVAFPVLPLWWIRRQTRLDQEMLADARTIERLGEPAAYASSLVSLSGPLVPLTELRRSIAVESTTRNGSNLYRRVLMLLRSPVPIETHPSLGWLARTTILIFGMTFLVTVLDARPVATQFTGQPFRPLVRPAFVIGSLALDGPIQLVVPSPWFEQFKLEGDLLTLTVALADLELVGLPFDPKPAIDPTGSPWGSLTTHHFTLHRTGDLLTLTVDGKVAAKGHASGNRVPLRFGSNTQLPVRFYNLRLNELPRPVANLAGGSSLHRSR